MSQPLCIVGMGGAQVADVQIFQMAGALGHPFAEGVLFKAASQQ